ncbi:MAG: GTP pyrophosphokinase family protein [Lachnospiraceae bacterium]|nr:GTP pyrophosphokinase family protein [Lachnospiraceae bacterium]
MSVIYGKYKQTLNDIANELSTRLEIHNNNIYDKTGYKLFEHISSRVKSEESMIEKCERKGVPANYESALGLMRDAIGIRIVSTFIDDIQTNIDYIKNMPDVTVVKEKDYIKHAKPNGYRSYHLILDVEWDEEDFRGNTPGHYFVEVQLRTIAMDSWAALEHQLKYKKDVPNHELIESELKRVADEINSCDLSMKTIRNLIRGSI